ncbi:MAG: TetR/AcrR family transcriptional regulator [Candidatus Coproplasma sp.]
MTNTKERILNEAVKLFSQKGYDAVSVADIADAVGIKAPSLYKHYKSKRDIFDSILDKINRADYEKAENYGMPEDGVAVDNNKYKNIDLKKIREYSKEMLLHWTKEEFFCNFRKMLTLEQYKSKESAELYSQYISCGPLKYMADIFADYTGNYEQAYALALEFYGTMFFLYSLYDKEGNSEKITALLDKHLDNFTLILKAFNYKEQKI